MNVLLKGGKVISPGDNLCETKNIAVVDGRVCFDNIDCVDFDEIIDCSDKIISPGLIDVHVHMRDPGYEYKEDINTAAKAAAKGGITTIVGMPNTLPAVDNKTVVRYIIEKGEKTDITVLTTGSASKDNKNETLAEIGDMKLAGICAVSDDAYPVQSSGMMRRVLQYTNNFGLPFMVHSEDKSLTTDAAMNEGYNASVLGLRPWPREAEEIMIYRNAILANLTKCHVHFQHLTTKGGVEAVRWAKSCGYPVSAETCPQYFTLTDEAVLGYDTNAKCNPPLRTKADVEAIIDGLKDDTIDIIATDHAPHAAFEKEVEFSNASFGMVGLETALSLCIDILYHKNSMDMCDVIKKLTVNPAKLINSSQGCFSSQNLADIVVFDINSDVKVDKNTFESKSRNTPFDGLNLKGDVFLTVAKGKICYRK